jgi:hypothetical protein
VGNRTPDLLITSELLCQLSYVGLRRYARTAGRAAPPSCLRAMDHRNGAPGRGLSLVAPERLGKVAVRFARRQARHGRRQAPGRASSGSSALPPGRR